MELQELINSICEEVDSLPSSQRKRHLTEYLNQLLRYQKNNPDEPGVPTNLQLYCDEFPNALECRIYDD